jgi:hypothetical protein
MAGNGGRTETSASKFDDLVIAALVTGCTHEQAAAKAGCSCRTVDRRATDPAFRRRLDGVRHEVLSRVTDAVTNTLLAAVARLSSALANPDDDVGIRAANTLFTHAIHLHELRDVAGRLANIQTLAKAFTTGGPNGKVPH